MRRLFWVALGAAAGVLMARKVTKVAQTYSPGGLARSVSTLADAMRETADVIRDGMAEREQELRGALGVDAGTMDPKDARSLLEDPSAQRRGR